MAHTLIRWRLREVMARYKIKAIDLAQAMGLSANSVSNLRKSDTMPRIDGDSLNRLCNCLNKLALDLDQEITPVTLIEYHRDLEPDDRYRSSSEMNFSAHEKTNRGTSSSSSSSPSLIIFPGPPQSA